MKRPSHLERKFLLLWRAVKGPPLEPEFRFHPTRKWRADFAHIASRTLIEIEGGVWRGRHTTGAGFIADCEKYLEAQHLGWRVVRLSSAQLTGEWVGRVAGWCRAGEGQGAPPRSRRLPSAGELGG